VAARSYGGCVHPQSWAARAVTFSCRFPDTKTRSRNAV